MPPGSWWQLGKLAKTNLILIEARRVLTLWRTWSPDFQRAAQALHRTPRQGERSRKALDKVLSQ